MPQIDGLLGALAAPPQEVIGRFQHHGQILGGQSLCPLCKKKQASAASAAAIVIR
jgi:hypothetical protein